MYNHHPISRPQTIIVWSLAIALLTSGMGVTSPRAAPDLSGDPRPTLGPLSPRPEQRPHSPAPANLTPQFAQTQTSTGECPVPSSDPNYFDCGCPISPPYYIWTRFRIELGSFARCCCLIQQGSFPRDYPTPAMSQAPGCPNPPYASQGVVCAGGERR
jgi:hypothetical protein